MVFKCEMVQMYAGAMAVSSLIGTDKQCFCRQSQTARETIEVVIEATTRSNQSERSKNCLDQSESRI